MLQWALPRDRIPKLSKINVNYDRSKTKLIPLCSLKLVRVSCAILKSPSQGWCYNSIAPSSRSFHWAPRGSSRKTGSNQPLSLALSNWACLLGLLSGHDCEAKVDNKIIVHFNWVTASRNTREPFGHHHRKRVIACCFRRWPTSQQELLPFWTTRGSCTNKDRVKLIRGRPRSSGNK